MAGVLTCPGHTVGAPRMANIMVPYCSSQAESGCQMKVDMVGALHGGSICAAKVLQTTFKGCRLWIRDYSFVLVLLLQAEWTNAFYQLDGVFKVCSKTWLWARRKRLKVAYVKLMPTLYTKPLRVLW